MQATEGSAGAIWHYTVVLPNSAFMSAAQSIRAGRSLKKVIPAKNPHVSKAQPIRSVHISKEQHWSVHGARKGSQRDSRRATQVSTDASIPLSYNPKLDSLMLPSVSRELYSA